MSDPHETPGSTFIPSLLSRTTPIKDGKDDDISSLSSASFGQIEGSQRDEDLEIAKHEEQKLDAEEEELREELLNAQLVTAQWKAKLANSQLLFSLFEERKAILMARQELRNSGSSQEKIESVFPLPESKIGEADQAGQEEKGMEHEEGQAEQEEKGMEHEEEEHKLEEEEKCNLTNDDLLRDRLETQKAKARQLKRQTFHASMEVRKQLLRTRAKLNKEGIPKDEIDKFLSLELVEVIEKLLPLELPH